MITQVEGITQAYMITQAEGITQSLQMSKN